MNTLRLAAVAALALSFAAPSEAATIHNDNGGYVFQHAMRFARASKPIRIMGSCKSACTLALSYPSTCVGPRASLTFHAPFGAGKHNARIKQWLLGRYPATIRSWIRAQGGLTSRAITLRGAELHKRVRSCS
jgi:hypothetical protein